MSWRKGSPIGGEDPATFHMSGIEIFIDESGDFGPFDVRCPYYIVTMVFHESNDPLYSDIQELEYRLSLLGLEDHCIHSSPAIRGEGAYYGVPLALRRKIMSNFAAFVRKSNLKYKCFFVKKGVKSSQEEVVAALRDAMDGFLNDNYDRLSSYAPIIVSYDKGQRQLSALIAEMFESRFANVRLTKTLPVSSRIFQVADFVCTLKRLVYKLEGEGALSKSENIFFGTKSSFLKNWVIPVRRNEWI